VENHLGELWALMRFLEPGLLGSWEAFRFSFAEPIEAGLSQPLEQLRQLVLPFVLRRTKAAVLAELPPRTEQLLEVELHPEERALYTALREQAEELLDALDEPQPLQILAQLTRLRMACCHPSLVLEGDAVPASAKLEAFGELVEQLRAGGHRALVFSQFVRHLAILRAWLDARGVRYRYLDGGTPAGQRDRAVRAFQEGDGDLFLISLRAGGFGLNLTAADAVIHMDPWWNPAVEDQASDRVHRIGQRRPVTVYRLVAQGTVEEKILALHERKRELAQQLLAGSDAAARLSAAELMALIRDDAP
jgi:SNF2 family DNA or RNA helicase